ncbi:MAG: DsbA family protein [Proteobacteria bacterium]|nr:DsbA family protein [Pseudomonadota bacterium]
MNRNIFIFAISLFATANTVHANSFNETQKKEIESIIQEYLIKNPEILAQAIQALQVKKNQEWMAQIKKTIVTRIDELFKSKSPTLTVENPKLSIIEFFDYNCPHCKKFSKIIDTTVSQNKDIQVIYKELPVLSETSLFAAKAALAAKEQNKYQEFHQKLMSLEGGLSEEAVAKAAKELGLDINKLSNDMNSPKVMEELRNNQKLAVELGIRGTPTVIIGRYPATQDMPIEVISGDVPQEAFNQNIESVRNPPSP